ncbi:hypothetical protein GWK36_02230 [Caldichromatium japonicum]|uniref:Uncharacterized protein n=1 Tax=Caldichromatium japonicum TaxID=2699430 RepID=A0A6G7VAB7_9GAMM|nr:hypothetical protein [Caldichromatium japonicum]QIK37009.1 hypothetical protein GWK36_02230 [Caldichromatium japonicum]
MLAALILAACAAPCPLSAPINPPETQIAPDLISDPPPAAGSSGALAAGEYGMLYFSGHQGTRIATDLALNRLYEDALPGYGLYTFVLPGSKDAHSAAGDRLRQRELLRLIETYASDSEEQDKAPRPDSHVFVVPVRARSLDAPLAELLAAELGGLMRRELAGILRQRGHGQWAMRLERNPGPFLVSAPEPRLIPDRGGMPRLLIDLSGMGFEVLYDLVDRYDQDLPAGLGGRPEALMALRTQLSTLPAWSQLGPQARLITP